MNPKYKNAHRYSNYSHYIAICIFLLSLSACETTNKLKNNSISTAKNQEPIAAISVSKNNLLIQLPKTIATSKKIKAFSQQFEAIHPVEIDFSYDNSIEPSIITEPLTENLLQAVLQESLTLEVEKQAGKTEISKKYYPFLLERPAILSDRKLSQTNDKSSLNIADFQDYLVNWATDIRLGNEQHKAKACGYTTDHVLWHFLAKNPHYFSITKKVDSKNNDHLELQLNNLSGIREISLLKSWFDSGIFELPKETPNAVQQWLSGKCGMISDWSGTFSQSDGLKESFWIPLSLPFVRGFIFRINEKVSEEQQKNAKLWLDWVMKNKNNWSKETGFLTDITDLINSSTEENIYLLNPYDAEKYQIVALENTVLNLLHVAFSGIPAMVVVKNKPLLKIQNH